MIEAEIQLFAGPRWSSFKPEVMAIGRAAMAIGHGEIMAILHEVCHDGNSTATRLYRPFGSAMLSMAYNVVERPCDPTRHVTRDPWQHINTRCHPLSNTEYRLSAVGERYHRSE